MNTWKNGKMFFSAIVCKIIKSGLIFCGSDFYSTPSTEGVESKRGNSVCLSVCVSVCLSVITFSFVEYSTIWWFRPCRPYIFWKLNHTGNQYRPFLTQYHRVPTSTTLYWPSIQWFDGLDHINQIFSESISHWQLIPPCFDPVSPSTDQYHPILMQYHQVTTIAALYRPSTIKY